MAYNKVVNPPETFQLPRLRLRLRQPVPGDAQAIFEYGNDPAVAHFADWPVCTSLDQIVASIPTNRGMRSCIRLNDLPVHTKMR
jgi:RimJ/RimL family protein N-acetyltransferase